jgi:heptosyltransferase-3
VSILVIHPGPLGDLLLAVPALRALRATGPAEPLLLAAQPRLGGLLSALGVVDAHRGFDALGLEPLFVEDAAEPRVAALRDCARVVCWFGARDPVFPRRLRTAATGALVASPTGDGTVPVWEHLLGTVGAPPGSWREPLAVPPALFAEGRRALEEAGWDGGTPLLVVHPGAGGLAKRWPVAGFVETLGGLRARRRLRVVVHQGPADHEVATTLAAQLGGGAIVLKEPTLTTLAGALAHAAAYLGNDSGPSHLAAAVGVPSVILFEAAKLAWRPWWDGALPLVVDTGSLRQADVVAVADRLAATLR